MKIASPMWIIREDAKRDLLRTIDRVADAGFDGIEFLGFYGHGAGEISRRMRERGMAAMSSHVPYGELAEDPDKVFQFHEEIGCPFVVIGGLPLTDQARTKDEVESFARKAAGHGIRLLYHNHAPELSPGVSGKAVLMELMDSVPAEALSLEPDLGWIEIGGGNAAEYLTKYRDRCPVIHFKDYYATDRSKIGDVNDLGEARGGGDRGNFEFRPVGYGVMDFAGLLPLVNACRPEWLVADHDLAYDRDPYRDLAISLEFMRNLCRM